MALRWDRQDGFCVVYQIAAPFRFLCSEFLPETPKSCHLSSLHVCYAIRGNVVSFLGSPFQHPTLCSALWASVHCRRKHSRWRFYSATEIGWSVHCDETSFVDRFRLAEALAEVEISIFNHYLVSSSLVLRIFLLCHSYEYATRGIFHFQVFQVHCVFSI